MWAMSQPEALQGVVSRLVPRDYLGARPPLLPAFPFGVLGSALQASFAPSPTPE